MEAELLQCAHGWPWASQESREGIRSKREAIRIRLLHLSLAKRLCGKLKSIISASERVAVRTGKFCCLLSHVQPAPAVLCGGVGDRRLQPAHNAPAPGAASAGADLARPSATATEALRSSSIISRAMLLPIPSMAATPSEPARESFLLTGSLHWQTGSSFQRRQSCFRLFLRANTS